MVVNELTGLCSAPSTRETMRVTTLRGSPWAAITPWYEQRASLRAGEFKADLASATLASIDYWFYTNTTLTAVAG